MGFTHDGDHWQMCHPVVKDQSTDHASVITLQMKFGDLAPICSISPKNDTNGCN